MKKYLSAAFMLFAFTAALNASRIEFIATDVILGDTLIIDSMRVVSEKMGLDAIYYEAKFDLIDYLDVEGGNEGFFLKSGIHRDYLNIEFYLEKASHVRFEVYNSLGAEVFSENIDGNEGVNYLKKNTASWPTGPYYLRILANGKNERTSVMKLNNLVMIKQPGPKLKSDVGLFSFTLYKQGFKDREFKIYLDTELDTLIEFEWEPLSKFGREFIEFHIGGFEVIDSTYYSDWFNKPKTENHYIEASIINDSLIMDREQTYWWSWDPSCGRGLHDYTDSSTIFILHTLKGDRCSYKSMNPILNRQDSTIHFTFKIIKLKNFEVGSNYVTEERKNIIVKNLPCTFDENGDIYVEILGPQVGEHIEEFSDNYLMYSNFHVTTRKIISYGGFNEDSYIRLRLYNE